VVARALRPGGVFVGYVPTVLQLKDTVETLQQRPDFGEIESFETLMRNWHVKGMSVRPVHRMIAHSAFIIVARRLADMPADLQLEPVATSDAESSSEARTEPDYDAEDNSNDSDDDTGA
jgi:hypothetical protein